jgi:hypothetical protein
MTGRLVLQNKQTYSENKRLYSDKPATLSTVALALIYKPLFSLVFVTARLCQELQLLLEKDLGHN